MAVFNRIIKCIQLTNGNTRNQLARKFYTIYKKEFDVSQFSNINITCPYNVELQTLDVHKYPKYDKIFVELNSSTAMAKVNLVCEKHFDTIDIKDDSRENKYFIICNVRLPMKSNVNVFSTDGNIFISGFNSDNIILRTENCDIVAEKCYSNIIKFVSKSGNITCKDVIQANEITLHTRNNGYINTQRLQGSKLNIETENGDIKVQSSYCNKSQFQTRNGSINLHNTHKDVLVKILNRGNLKMLGVDGNLNAILEEGNADLQISRFLGNSHILIRKCGDLVLKLFETCQENTTIQIDSNTVLVENNVKMKNDSVNNKIILRPNSDETAKCFISCKNSNVNIQNSSWLEMFNFNHKGM